MFTIMMIIIVIVIIIFMNYLQLQGTIHQTAINYYHLITTFHQINQSQAFPTLPYSY